MSLPPTGVVADAMHHPALSQLVDVLVTNVYVSRASVLLWTTQTELSDFH